MNRILNIAKLGRVGVVVPGFVLIGWGEGGIASIREKKMYCSASRKLSVL